MAAQTNRRSFLTGSAAGDEEVFGQLNHAGASLCWDHVERARRSRRATVLWLTGTIALGLATREVPSAFGDFVATHAGDALWATAVFFAAASVAPSATTRAIAATALGLAFAIELSQLAHPDWLETVRRWPGMRLVLGYGFLWGDLVRYVVGVAVAIVIDRTLLARVSTASS